MGDKEDRSVLHPRILMVQMEGSRYATAARSEAMWRATARDKKLIVRQQPLTTSLVTRHQAARVKYARRRVTQALCVEMLTLNSSQKAFNGRSRQR